MKSPGCQSHEIATICAGIKAGDRGWAVGQYKNMMARATATAVRQGSSLPPQQTKWKSVGIPYKIHLRTLEFPYPCSSSVGYQPFRMNPSCFNPAEPHMCHSLASVGIMIRNWVGKNTNDITSFLHDFSVSSRNLPSWVTSDVKKNCLKVSPKENTYLNRGFPSLQKLGRWVLPDFCTPTTVTDWVWK